MLSSQNSNIRKELCMHLSSWAQWTHIIRPTCEILNNCYQAGARICVICWNSSWCQTTDLPRCRCQSLRFISNIVFTRDTCYAHWICISVLFLTVCACVPMVPGSCPNVPLTYGAHWDTLPIPIKWSLANDSAAQL